MDMTKRTNLMPAKRFKIVSYWSVPPNRWQWEAGVEFDILEFTFFFFFFFSGRSTVDGSGL